jgi:hypothetical protein
LLVNVVVVLVPVAGLEFARIYEKQLLYALERNMNDQAALTRALLEDGLRRGVALDDPRHGDVLHEAHDIRKSPSVTAPGPSRDGGDRRFDDRGRLCAT